MLVGVICGDHWHAADIVQTGLNSLYKNIDHDDAVQFEYISDLEALTLEKLHQYTSIVLARANAIGNDHAWLTVHVQLAFRSYIEQGGSLLVIHAGTVGYRNEPVFSRLVGGYFTHHPESCEVTVQVTDPACHVISEQKPFTIFDEHYFVELLQDDMLNIFLKTESKYGTQPAGWTRIQGKGKVCVLTPGHYEEVWLHPQYQHVLKNALQWCITHSS